MKAEDSGGLWISYFLYPDILGPRTSHMFSSHCELTSMSVPLLPLTPPWSRPGRYVSFACPLSSIHASYSPGTVAIQGFLKELTSSCSAFTIVDNQVYKVVIKDK